MDLIIKNASLEELTSLCYRIGEPNYREMVEAERKFGVVEYLVNHGENLDSAETTYDKDLQDKKTQVAIENNINDLPEVKEAIQEVVQEEPVPVEEVKQEELHLDKPPETPQIDLKESLHQLATDLVNCGKSKELIEILDEFGAKSVPELNKSHHKAAIEKIKGVLNGNS